MIRVSYEQAVSKMQKALSRFLPAETARHFAEIFADNSLDGVHSHGMNRFPRYISDIENGICDASVLSAEKISAFGALECWDAHFGIGPVIAEAAAAQAAELAAAHGIGCIAVRNNSHWLRAGRYALQIAEKGFAGICFTNTCMNLSAWGAKTFSTGNNPISMSIPRKKAPLMMDMAVSQYAYGKLEVMAQEGKMLDFPCGFDSQGNETCDPRKIIEGGAMYPMAMWKGNALSIMLDLMAVTLSAGRSSLEMGVPADGEKGMSQVFIAINPAALGEMDKVEEKLEATINFFHGLKENGEGNVHIPGENLENIRKDNMRNGIPVTDATWDAICQLAI